MSPAATNASSSAYRVIGLLQRPLAQTQRQPANVTGRRGHPANQKNERDTMRSGAGMRSEPPEQPPQ